MPLSLPEPAGGAALCGRKARTARSRLTKSCIGSLVPASIHPHEPDTPNIHAVPGRGCHLPGVIGVVS